MTKLLATLVLLTAISAGAALAGDDCRPTSQPQSWEAVTQLANDYGWTIQWQEIDDGCYEILVTDAGGNHIKAKIDPATLDVVKAKIKKFADEGSMPAAMPATKPSN